MRGQVHRSMVRTILVLVALTTTVYADVEISTDVVPQKDPKKDLPPDIFVTVKGGAAAPPVDKIKLVQTDPKKGPIEMDADPAGLLNYVQGDESLGIVIVVEAHGMWLGNTGVVEEGNPALTPGVYKELTAAIDGFNKAGPSGSKGAIITYGRGAQLSEMGVVDLPNLTGAGMGTLKTIAGSEPTGQTNRDLVGGITEAAAVLKTKMSTSRKVLVVIGDGQDTNHDQGVTALKELGKQLAGDRVEVFAIFYDSGVLESDPNGFKALTRNQQSLNGVDGFGPAISKIVSDISDRFYIKFPGADIKLKKSFEWDEGEHTFMLKLDKEEIDLDDEIQLVPKWTPPWKRSTGGKFRWWLWFLILPISLLLLLFVVLKVIAGRRQPEPEPEPVVAAPPPVAAPAPAPMGAPKTIMIGIGGDDQGFPIVGWIVPLNGPNQFQTFKLQGGATKIGTGGASHIIINDTFMSTEHCQIVCSPAGFVLVDGGSTNGTQVNERRVDKHELVDNDVIMMGKTNFRFKSIN